MLTLPVSVIEGLSLVSVVYALSARHKKKPRNNKIKAVKPKETPMAIRASFSRSPQAALDSPWKNKQQEKMIATSLEEAII